jgi:hypothetical protein
LITTPAIAGRVLLRGDTPARYRWAPLGALIAIIVLREAAVRLFL